MDWAILVFQRTMQSHSLASPDKRHFRSAVLLLLWGAASVFGQGISLEPFSGGTVPENLLIPELARPMPLESESSLRPHKPRPWLFQAPPRSLDDRVWYSSEDDPPGSSDGVDGDERFQIWSGWDNPYFDFQMRGNGGGVGYETIYTQLLLADYGSGSWLLNCQASEPAGIQFNGMPNGPTVVHPSLSWFHDLAGGVGIQSFVGTFTRATNLDSMENLNRNLQYGLTLQSPLPLAVDSKQFFLFVEALGRCRRESIDGQQPPGGWQLLPGLSWQSSQRCWITGGVMMPFGSPGAKTGMWHVTCSWNF